MHRFQQSSAPAEQAGRSVCSEHDGIQERRGGRDGAGAKLADLENTCSAADLKHGLQKAVNLSADQFLR